MPVFIGKITTNEPEGFMDIALTEGDKPSRNHYDDVYLETSEHDNIKELKHVDGFVSIIDNYRVTFFADNYDQVRGLKIGDKVFIHTND